MPDKPLPMKLLDALEISKGVICLIGAGGKKSCMYHLAATSPGRVLLTSTAHMYPYDLKQIDRLIDWDDDGANFDLKDSDRVVALASKTDTPKRIGGVSDMALAEVLEKHNFDVCVVKGDGARARWIKAPEAHEPMIPPMSNIVIPVVSIKAIGRPLDDRTAHRPEKIAEVVRGRAGDLITARAVSKLLSSELGALKDVLGYTVVPLINMVDNARAQNLARKVAERALAQTTRFDKVLLAAMKTGQVKEIVTRGS